MRSRLLKTTVLTAAGGAAASAGHLAGARAERKRERRRMKEHAWKTKRTRDINSHLSVRTHAQSAT